MPKPYKKREFEYHFSQDDENTNFLFKKEFTILLAFLFPKWWNVKKWEHSLQYIVSIAIITIIITAIILYYLNSK